MSESLTPKPKRTRNRPDLANYGQEFIEAGDNSKYIRHALATLNLPPIDIANPKQVEARVEWYFNHCVESDMKPTVKGLCNALGGISRNTLRTWYNGECRANTHMPIIQKAYNLLEELWEDYMQNGKINPVSGIFLGKNNFGYHDKQEHVISPKTETVEALDVATIEEKYKELPEG